MNQVVDANRCYYDKTNVAGMADIHEENNVSPLMWAINNNNLELAAALIQAGSDVKFQR